MPDRSAVRASSLGANQSEEAQFLNAAEACSLVMRNGKSALGLICFLLCAVATMAAPQKGHLFATTSLLNCDSAPQATHLTVSVSASSCELARFASVARKSSSCTTPGGDSGIQFSAPQYGHFRQFVPGAKTRSAPHCLHGNWCCLGACVVSIRFHAASCGGR